MFDTIWVGFNPTSFPPLSSKKEKLEKHHGQIIYIFLKHSKNDKELNEFPPNRESFSRSEIRQ